jgi:hypothetical protein
MNVPSGFRAVADPFAEASIEILKGHRIRDPMAFA